MAGNAIVQIIAAVFALALYFLPALLADRRKRHDMLTLALFNACLGWTVFGWLLALYWSLQPNPPKNIAGEVAQTRKVIRMRAFSSALMLRVQKRASARDGSDN
ncbi:superinfection immunity protein [Paraburkholderia ginsengisoli]|uniref:Superinfection immunity protein n=1 Tax=Paraburkholderia ginsengisoli TaxID=311231 RepID=A0A7T4N9L3_9BURK|nr:superinfection immunity protein [Paraburkholderia ginsengisoli]QQC67791.1 superinfection immunity protein [Paraburkholderia ginsengisoli]